MKYKYHLIYQINNLINGKIYIGMHSTNNIDDGYFGSGQYIKTAIKKYGKENFKREILFIFDNIVEMVNKEKEIVTEEFIKRKDVYNAIVGGSNIPPNTNKKFNDDVREKMSQSKIGIKKGPVSAETREKIRQKKLGLKQSQELIDRRIAPLRGRKKPPTPQHIKDKISETKRKNKYTYTDERRKQISKTHWKNDPEKKKNALLKTFITKKTNIINKIINSLISNASKKNTS